MTLSHALAAVACWQLSPALLDPWLLPHNVQVGFLGSGDQTQQLGSQIPMPLGWSQLYLRQNQLWVAKQDPIYSLSFSCQKPNIKESRTKKNRICRTITCFSSLFITTLLPQQKTHKKHVFPPVLAVPRLAGGSGDSAAALGAGRFLAHALSLARRSWCKELKKGIKRADLEKPTRSTDSALAETIRIPAWCHLSQALVPQHVQGNRAHTNSSQTTTHRLLHIHQYTSGIYARGKHCSPSKNSTWRSIQPSFLRLLLQLCHRQRIELALWRRVTTSKDTRWISWCATCFSALPHRWHQLVHRVLEAWSTFFISKIPKICSTISQRGWPKIKFMKQLMFRFT